METSCPTCRHPYVLSDEWHAKKIKCSECGTIFSTDAEAAPGETRASGATGPAQADEDEVVDATPSAAVDICSECKGEFLRTELLDLRERLVCPGCKPVFLQKLQEGVATMTAGSLESGINGQYDFRIGDVIQEAWERTSGVKAACWGGMILSGIFIGLFYMALSFASIGLLSNQEFSGTVVRFILSFFQSAISAPFTLGLLMIGIRRAVDRPVESVMVFEFFPHMLALFLATLLTGLLTTMGYLLILPGIYLGVAYFATLPLIVDKKLGIWEAMEASRKGITHHWFKVFGVYLLMGLIVLASVIPLGIGLIWTIPMLFVSGGIIYRTIFGVEKETA